MRRFFCYCTMLIFCLAVESRGAAGKLPEPFEIPSNDAIHQFLDTVLADLFSGQSLPPKGDRGRYHAWSWGYHGRTSLLMFKATGDRRYLDLVKSTSLKLIAERDDALGLIDEERKLVIPSWGTRYKTGERANEVTTAGLITLPMCQFALMTGDKAIGDEATKTLSAFIAERRDAGGGAYYFWHKTDNVVEALNHSAVFGAALAYCSKLPNAPATFSETALGLLKYFERVVRPDGLALSWPYAPSPDSPHDLPAEAIWKAGVTIELPLALTDTGLLNRPDLMARIANVIKDNPHIKSGQIPKVIDSVQRTRPSIFQKNPSLARLMGGWFQIKDPALHAALLETMCANRDIFRGWLFGNAMPMGLAARLAQDPQLLKLPSAAIATCD